MDTLDSDLDLDRDPMMLTLRALDPVRDLDMTPGRRTRARARLEQITAEDPCAATAPRAARTGATSRRRPAVLRRWALAGAGVAAVGLAAAVVTTTLGSAPAYAGWTPAPSALSGPEQAALADACLEKSDVPGAHVRASERRGDTVALVAGDDDDTTVWCLARMPEGSTNVSDLEGGVSGGAGAVPAADQFTDGGRATRSPGPPATAGRRPS
ncbi:hypothetical protein [Brachybacterium huguangmaarense]